MQRRLLCFEVISRLGHRHRRQPCHWERILRHLLPASATLACIHTQRCDAPWVFHATALCQRREKTGDLRTRHRIVQINCVEGRNSLTNRWNHLEFVNNFNGFAYVKGEWPERWIHIDFRLLRDLCFGDLIEVSEWLVHECGHVCGFLKDLGVRTIVDEL